jgi:hypothetical protein
MDYRWTSDFAEFSSCSAQACPFVKHSTIYAEAGSSVRARRRRPVWRQPLRRCFDLVCANGRYRWSTDFPQFFSTDECRSGGVLKAWRTWIAMVRGPAGTLGEACKSLARQFAYRIPELRSSPRFRFASGLLAVALLVPVPAYAAALTFTWNTIKNNGLTSPTAAVHSGDTSIIDFTVLGNGTNVTGTITGIGTVTWDGSGPSNINATFSNWNSINLTSGSINFQATYNSLNLFGLSGTTYSYPSQPDNQFTGTKTPLATPTPSTCPVTFIVTFSSASWTLPSSPTQPSLQYYAQN